MSQTYLPSMTALRALEAFDRLGSTAAAGQALGLTQSAISRQLKTLESQLGTALFTREGRNLVLTPGAETYVEEMRDILARIAQAGLRLTTPMDDRQLTLAILPTFGMRWLVPRLPDFARAHPEVTINLTTRLKPFNFATEPLDAALHFGDGPWPGTRGLELRRETVLPVAAPSLMSAPLKSASEIATLPLLHIETRPDAWPDWCRAQGVTPPRGGGMTYDQFSTITQAALHGLGAALLPTYLAEPEIAAGRLVSLWGPPVDMPGAYFLVWPEARSDAPALSALRDWLRDEVDAEDMLPR